MISRVSSSRQSTSRQVSTRQSAVLLKFPYRGLMAPVFTPFDKEQNVNLTVIERYAQYLHSAGVYGILVNGSAGEGMALSEHERRLTLETWVREVQQYNITVMVQIGGTNMRDVKSLARHAEKCKVSGILCMPDLFYRPQTVDDLVHYLQLISAEAPHTPLLYYHIPSLTGINLNMRELLRRAHDIPTFVGIKFTDTDLGTGSLCVADDLKHLVVFLGADSLLLPSLFMGFDSAIATTLNIFPAYNKQIIRYFHEKDFEKAAKTQQTLNNCINQITENGNWLACMKAAMNKLTPINVGPVRDPQISVDLENMRLSLA